MAFEIVGSPSLSASVSNAKVLRRQNFQREANGIETLSETYTIRTSNLASLIPAKDTIHAAYSTASTKYSRMAVESISTSELDGGLTELSVLFVGLTSESGLPPAIVRLVPTTGAGVFGPPVVIEVEFVTSLSENEIVKGNFVPGTISQNAYWTTRRIAIPSSINGTPLPQNPRPPFNRVGGTGVAGGTFVVSSAIYDGYTISDVQTDRRGQFVIAKIQFREFFATSGTS